MTNYHFVKFQINAIRDYMINYDSVKTVTQNKDFDDIKIKLNNTKSLLDKIPEREYSYLSSKLDVYKTMKNTLIQQYNMQLVTNATMKIYEIISQMKLINCGKTTAFCNAELPGGFIIGINQYVKTMCPKSTFDWVASSYISEHGTLGDPYGIYAGNRAKWLMDSTMDGNLLKKENVTELSKRVLQRYPLGVDLYTSDAGCDVSSNYNEQEEQTMLLNYGQVLCGILTLAIGGSLITKQFTYFTVFNRSLIMILTVLFENVYITKPATSRPLNSEIYLVCTGFRGISGILRDYMINRMDDAHPNIPIILYEPNISLLSSARYIYLNMQISHIKYAYRIYMNNEYVDTRKYRKIQDSWLHHNVMNLMDSNYFIPIEAKKI